MWGQDLYLPLYSPPLRIIPMRVGTRLSRKVIKCPCQDHPHACGDKSLIVVIYLWRYRIIPMRVGTSFIKLSQNRHIEDHPHACGDKIYTSLSIARHSGSSPCVWGQGNTAPINSGLFRIIPMRVGTSLKLI